MLWSENCRFEVHEMLAPDVALLTRLKPFRAQLREMVGAVTDGHAADTIDLTFLNTQLATGHVQLKSSEIASAFKTVYQAAALPGAPILLAWALSAIRLLAEQPLTQVSQSGLHVIILL